MPAAISSSPTRSFPARCAGLSPRDGRRTWPLVSGSWATAHPVQALPALESILLQDPNSDLRIEVCRTLAAFDSPEIPQVVLKGWKLLPQIVRVEAINLLAERKEWARELLGAVRHKQIL